MEDLIKLGEILASLSTTAIFISLYLYERRAHDNTRDKLEAYLETQIEAHKQSELIDEAKKEKE